MEIIKTNLQFIQSEVQEGDDTCYELVFNKEESDIQPFLTDGCSEAKRTQNTYQLLNSNFYERHLIIDSENPIFNSNRSASET